MCRRRVRQQGGARAAASQELMHVLCHQPKLSRDFGMYCWLQCGLAWPGPALMFCRRNAAWSVPGVRFEPLRILLWHKIALR